MENETLVNRLKAYMEYTGLSNTQFADRAGIPRPSLSQILSGRNKKINNELIDKLHVAFPRLNVIWLLFGEGSMTEDDTLQNGDSGRAENRTDALKRIVVGNEAADDVLKNDRERDFEAPDGYGLPRSTPQASLFDTNHSDAYHKPYSIERKTKSNATSESKQSSRADSAMPRVERLTPATEADGRKVVSIMVFYSDNSFEVFKPEQSE